MAVVATPSFRPDQVRAWLDANDRNQAWLSRRMNSGEGTISKYLNGHLTPGPRVIRRMEAAMGVPDGSLTQEAA